jgi:hypothetical protein
MGGDEILSRASAVIENSTQNNVKDWQLLKLSFSDVEEALIFLGRTEVFLVSASQLRSFLEDPGAHTANA